MADDAGPGRTAAYLYMGEGEIPRDAVHIEVHRSVEFIPDRLFKYYDRLGSLLLRDGLLRIGMRVFLGCSSLRSFRCPATVTVIGQGAFYGCSMLAEVVLPEGLQSIEAGTFGRCWSLREIRIPATVARIGDGAFSGCANLALIDLREGLRWIGKWAFEACPSLESLRLPSSVEEVGEGAFGYCTNLSVVRLHEDLGRIGRRAFWGCTSLSFRFVRLSQRMEAVALDERTASVFEGRLNEITDAMVGEADNPWEECKERLRRAHEVLTYVLKGATTTLELALWRTKIEEVGEAEVIGNDQRMRDVGDVGGLEPERNIDRKTWQARQGCHVRCGANVVIPEVLKFFSYSTTWS